MTRDEREPLVDPSLEELKNTNYELFVAALSILSIFNLGIILVSRDPVVDHIVAIIDVPLSAIFLIDFVFRLKTAKSRRFYLFRQFGWADLLACIPLTNFNLLRLFRTWRSTQLMRQYGSRNLVAAFARERAWGALLVVLFLLMIVIEFGAMFVYLSDRRSPDANIKTASDAVWWAYITALTIGYGDRYPVTSVGRIWALAVAAAGVGLFSVLTSYLVNAFTTTRRGAIRARRAGAGGHGLVPADPVSSMSEIVELVAEQRQAQEALLQRLEAIERHLAMTRSTEEGGRADRWPSDGRDADRG